VGSTEPPLEEKVQGPSQKIFLWGNIRVPGGVLSRYEREPTIKTWRIGVSVSMIGPSSKSKGPQPNINLKKTYQSGTVT